MRLTTVPSCLGPFGTTRCASPLTLRAPVSRRGAAQLMAAILFLFGYVGGATCTNRSVWRYASGGYRDLPSQLAAIFGRTHRRSAPCGVAHMPRARMWGGSRVGRFLGLLGREEKNVRLRRCMFCFGLRGVVRKLLGANDRQTFLRRCSWRPDGPTCQFNHNAWQPLDFRGVCASIVCAFPKPKGDVGAHRQLRSRRPHCGAFFRRPCAGGVGVRTTAHRCKRREVSH